MGDDKINHTHSLFLHPSDTPSSVLIPIQLTGSENYGLWRGLIRFNRVRIFQLHREIATISQGTDSVDTYFTKLKELWSEYDALVPSPGCDCVKSKDYIVHLHQQRLLQFLSGFNESYDQARRQILMKTTEPTLNQAYALICEDESQRSSPYPALAVKADANVMQAGRGTIPRGEPIAMQVGRRQPYKGKKPFMRGDYCHKNGHLKENCFKLIGYREDFKAKRQVVANSATGVLEREQQIQMNGEKGASYDQVAWHFFTEDQYMQILNMLNKDTSVPQVNMAAASLDLLHSKTKLKGEQKEQVQLPTGERTDITHTGSATILKDLEDLWSGRVRRISKGKGGLYVVKDAHIAKVLQQMSTATTQKPGFDGHLWHQRLGHASVSTMKHIKSFQHATVDLNVNKDCSVCPLAKQSRLPTVVLDEKIPYELLYHTQPSLNHLRGFGCLCYATTLVHGNKFSARAKSAVHLGYSETQKGYKLLDLSTNQFLVCRDVVFKEHLFPFIQPSLWKHSMVHDKGSVQVNHEPFPANHDFLQQEDHEGIEPASTSHPQEAVVSPIEDSTPIPIPGVDNVPTEEVQNGHAANEYTQGETSTAPSLHDIVSEEEHDAMYLPQDVDTLPEIEPALASEEPRRSSRNVKEPLWLKDYVTQKKNNGTTLYPLSGHLTYSKLSASCQRFVAKISSLTEPQSFAEASKDKRWVEAMQLEIKALEDNKTWEIVDLPKGKNTIGSKWMYKIKFKADGEVEIFKARLVAKGYSQKEGLDYHEIFSPYTKW
nr:uncharacterized protein LOC104097202 [Nicotiana tomentosiformis]